ncbi:sodium:proton antiporter [Rubrolithibacter danxiaensis]|uniref:sodium:proton antiporter n=1 Tax=Rubrolithibacter danxiaensis TaxID=3390805 RepID=UPI003BF8B1FA
MTTYQILMLLSGLVIFSYLFDLIASKTKLPSVLLLLFSGIGLRELVTYFALPTFNFITILPPLGAVGLILIVFEGALELKYHREKNQIIKRAIFSAFIILLTNTFVIAFILHFLTKADLYLCFANAIPFSIVSSSIAIPSASAISKEKKEFVIYESSFSDILGIILFNFVITNQNINLSSFVSLSAEIGSIAVIAVISCALLLYIMGRIHHHIKFFLILAILVLIYSLGQQYHLSSLIIVLAFGLFLNNADEIKIPLFKKYFIYPQLSKDLVQLFQLSAESAFIVRTFFFVIFGFTMHIEELRSISILQYGICIIVAIYIIRIAGLKLFAKSNFFPEVIVSPRGLISILLYYHLPQQFRILGVETGLMFLVILSTCLIMSFGLLAYSKKDAKADQ